MSQRAYEVWKRWFGNEPRRTERPVGKFAPHAEAVNDKIAATRGPKRPRVPGREEDRPSQEPEKKRPPQE